MKRTLSPTATNRHFIVDERVAPPCVSSLNQSVCLCVPVGNLSVVLSLQ